jgi:DNA-binding GntR family transcriptional regulator
MHVGGYILAAYEVSRRNVVEQQSVKNLTEEAYQKITGCILRSEIYPRQKIIMEELASATRLFVKL